MARSSATPDHLRSTEHQLRSPDHLRTPSNGMSECSADNNASRRLLTAVANNHQLMAAHGYAPGPRYAPATAVKLPGQHQQQQHQLQQQNLHVSLMNTSKPSLSPTASASPGTAGNQTKTTLTLSHDDSLPLNLSANGPLCSSLYMPDRSMAAHGHHSILSNGLKGMANGGVNIRRSSQPTGAPVTRVMRQAASKVAVGVREMLISLGLLCLLSLLMGLLALVFLLKMSPPPDPYNFDQVRIVSAEEQTAVYEVSLALCSLSLTLDVCCCLVCAAQLLFAARLITASSGLANAVARDNRIKKFLRDSAATRICAIAGFFVSIPVFLSDVVLYTLLQFPSMPAITTSILITVGIVLCGLAMLHNIVVWRRHKKASTKLNGSMVPELSVIGGPSMVTGNRLMSPSQMPPATLDLSNLTSNKSVNASHLSNGQLELSTLV